MCVFVCVCVCVCVCVFLFDVFSFSFPFSPYASWPRNQPRYSTKCCTNVS